MFVYFVNQSSNKLDLFQETHFIEQRWGQGAGYKWLNVFWLKVICPPTYLVSLKLYSQFVDALTVDQLLIDL